MDWNTVRGSAGDAPGTRRGRGGSVPPLPRIHGPTVLPDFEIEGWPRLATRIPDVSKHIAVGQPVADLAGQVLIVAVQAEVAAAMIQHEQQTQTGQPVRVDDPAGPGRTHCRAGGRRDENAIPTHLAASPGLAKISQQRPGNGPAAFAQGSRWGRSGGRSFGRRRRPACLGSRPFDVPQHTLQRGGLGPGPGKLLLLALHFRIQAGHHSGALLAGAIQFRQLRAAAGRKLGEYLALAGDCQAILLQGFQAPLDRTQQLAAAPGEIGEPGQTATQCGRVLLAEDGPDPLAATGNVREAQLPGQGVALLIQFRARRVELLVEGREALLCFGKLSARAIEVPPGPGGGGLGFAELTIEFAAPAEILSILFLEVSNALPHAGKVLLGLARFGGPRRGGAGSRRPVHPGWQGQKQRQAYTEHHTEHRPGSLGHGYNAPPARSDLMNKLLEFAAANPYLVTGTVLMLIAVVAFELRLRARAAFEVTVAEAIRMINNGATVVDVRESAQFSAGHIVGAVNMQPAELAKDAEVKIKKKRAVVVVCASGGESIESARKLRAAGFDGAFSIGGGLDAWQRENQPLITPRRRA